MTTKFAGFIAAVTLLAGNAATAVTPAASEAGAVVTSFCDAISSRNLDKVLGYLAPGSVQFSLRPSHAGLGGQPPTLTSDLRAHWSTIAPVVFGATKSYSRSAKIIDSRVDGDIATVWATVVTTTVRGDKPETKREEFVELYLLVRKDGQWKIGAVADNRRPSDVGIGGGKP